MRSRLALRAFLVPFAPLPAGAGAAPVPAGAEWSENTFPSSNGVTLHADIRLPKGLASDAKTPVNLSIGPYFNHSVRSARPARWRNTSYDPVGPAGPSDRFVDFIEGANLMERGYARAVAWRRAQPGPRVLGIVGT